MDRAELVRLYPRLFHMAEANAWDGIVRHGLLSTAALLDLYEVKDPTRSELLTRRRAEGVTLRHPMHGSAVIRDNKPLSESKLAAALTDMTTGEWLALLNSRVFFFLQEQRLNRLLAARAYRTRSHLVITVDTDRLLGLVGENNVHLSRINTGSTAYAAVARGSQTFRSIADFDHPPRKRPLANASDVAELCVQTGVPDITSVAERAALHTPDGITSVWERTSS